MHNEFAGTNPRRSLVIMVEHSGKRDYRRRLLCRSNLLSLLFLWLCNVVSHSGFLLAIPLDLENVHAMFSERSTRLYRQK